MADLPRVSIITPSFNQGQFLEQTMLSVLEQDYPHIEYIVIDGGSTDNSVEVIRRYADRLAHWESQRDRGQAHAINKGLAHATGDILGWLNSDDILLPGVVRQTVEVFARHPEIDVVYGRLERIDEHGQPVPTPKLPKDRLTFGKRLVIGECIVNQPGSFWRRSIQAKASPPDSRPLAGESGQDRLEASSPGPASGVSSLLDSRPLTGEGEQGPLDDTLMYVMDYEYWIRLALAGAQFMRLPQSVALFRLSSASKTVAQSARMAEEQQGVLAKLLQTPDLPARLGLTAAQVRRQYRRTSASIALHAFYGYLKQRDGRQARHWLALALCADPTVLFQRRWLDLAWAGFRRRVR